MVMGSEVFRIISGEVEVGAVIFVVMGAADKGCEVGEV